MMKMVEVLGLPPHHLLVGAPKTAKYFDRLSDGSFAPKRPESQQVWLHCVVFLSCEAGARMM